MDIKSIMAMGMMNNSNSGNSIFNTIISTVMVASIAHIEKAVEKVVNWFNNILSKQIDKGIEEVLQRDDTTPVSYELSHIHDKYYVKIVYNKKDKEDYTSEDYVYLKALLHKFMKNNNFSSFRVCRNISIPTDTGKEYEITEGIYLIVNEFSVNSENELSYFDCILSSKTHKSSQIFSYLKIIAKELETDKTSNIMNEIYAFTVDNTREIKYNPNYIPDKKTSDIFSGYNNKREEIASAPEELTFKTTAFTSNRKQENIRGKVSNSIFKKLNFFIRNRKWYSEKGIPYHFTCMLSGEPGMGKTSCIKATANTTNRHLFIVDCSVIKTSKQFMNLFMKEEVLINKNGSKTSVKIPIENRIYVLEEIDILGDILKDRREVKDDKKLIPGELTLDDFLNVLDGNIESPGRIIFITSNYPEKLDKALLRGGRIDILAKFEYISSDDIIDYISFFNGKPVDNTLSDNIRSCKDKWYITYADLCQILFSSTETEDVYRSIIIRNEEKKLDNEKYESGSEQSGNDTLYVSSKEDEYVQKPKKIDLYNEIESRKEKKIEDVEPWNNDLTAIMKTINHRKENHESIQKIDSITPWNG
jgi:hypothetical protein